MSHISVAESLQVVDCAGVPIVACTPEEAAREVVRRAAERHATDVHLCNAYTLALADGDPQLRGLLRSAGLNFPDGQGVVWANRLLHRGQQLPVERVYGPDLFLEVCRIGRAADLGHYLLGSTPEVLDRLGAELSRRFLGLRIVGSEAPPFRPVTEAERQAQFARISASGAHIVWVGLGTPKQDLEAARLAARHDAVFVAVGAAFDFISGNKAQAPLWMQRSGLEWLFRLAGEPRRLWRRYAFGLPQFAWAACKGAVR